MMSAGHRLARLLEAMGYDVTAVSDGTSAISSLESSPHFDFVLTDLRLPDLDGREVVLAAQKTEPGPRIALVTGWDVDAEEQNRLGVEWVFLKPVNVRDMVSKMRCAEDAKRDWPESTFGT